MKRILVTLMLVGVGGLLMSSSAQAETCSPDGKFCLETESSAAAPLIPPATILLNVTTQADDPQGPVVFITTGFALIKHVQLVQSGPPGGMNTWSATLEPGAPDGPIGLEVRANGGGGSFTDSADFTGYALATATNFSHVISTQGTHFVDRFGYLGRIALKAAQTVTLGTGSNPYYGRRVKQWVFTASTAPGQQTVTARLPAKQVRQACRRYRSAHTVKYTGRFRQCSLQSGDQLFYGQCSHNTDFDCGYFGPGIGMYELGAPYRQGFSTSNVVRFKIAKDTRKK